jgi:cyclic beta-1,2-glucan synthetase
LIQLPGSAGSMLRFIVESLLGPNVESSSLRFAACLPAHWDSYEVNYRVRKALYRIRVLQTTVEDGGPHLTADGVELPGSTIPLTDDGGEHAVVVRIHAIGA